MELERFREIRTRVSEIVALLVKEENNALELTSQQKEELELETERLTKEVHNSDLSNISFEEYEGFYDIGFDFSGTGANIDFNLIDESYNEFKLRFQGCNIKNLDLSKIDTRYLDDQSFSKEIMELNPEFFAPKEITDQNVRERYYDGILNLSDLKKYNLKNIEPIHIELSLVWLINRIGIESVFNLDEEIVTLLGSRFSQNVLLSDLNQFSSYEEIDRVLKNTVIREITYPGVRVDDNLFQSSYVQKNLQEYVIDFPKDKEELLKKFNNGALSVNDISNNLDLFKGKKFVDRLLYFTLHGKNYPNLTEEQIIYLMEKIPEISALLKNDKSFLYVANMIDIEKEPEENKLAIVNILKKYREENLSNQDSEIGSIVDLVLTVMSTYEELINDPYLNLPERARLAMLQLVSNPSIRRLEAVESIDIKSLIKKCETNFFDFFNKYGIDTVLDFENENGQLFTKDNATLINFIKEAYLYYSGNNHNPKTSLSEIKKWNDPNPEYTIEQFEEFVRRMIVYGPTNGRFEYINKLDYRNLRGSFREKNPELFLPDDAPTELQDKFYKSSITIEDISRHPEYIPYLKNVDVGIAFEYLPFVVENNNSSSINFIKEKAGSLEGALKFINGNASIVKYLKKNISSELIISQDMSLDDIILKANKEIEYRIIHQDITYGEDAPEYFKVNHKEYFLEDDAPDILKKAFYPDRRKTEGNHTVFFDKDGIRELTEQRGWQQYLIGKQKDIRKSVLEDFIRKADKQAIEETFRYYLDKDYEIITELISSLTTEDILRMKITISDELLEKLLEKGTNDTLKILLFSEKVDREKILLLSRYKEVNTQTNTLDSALSSIYLENRGDVDELNKKIDEIYNLFTFDNVPEFLKTYKLFELGEFALVENNRIKSYVGVNQKVKRNIILTDLFRISIDSNNKSMKDFANILKYGDEILSKVAENGQFDLSSLSEAEHAVFSQYIDTLVSMHNISVSNSDNKKIIEITHNLETDLSSLQQQYGNGELQFSSSRVLTGLFNGEITSELTPDSVLLYMEKKREQRLQQIKENSNLIKNKSLRLESGDYIKGIRDFNSYLKSMLRYGLKCGEFNRENSHSDATKLDLDFGYVSDANLKPGQKTDYDVILTTISATYGNTYIVLKDYGKKFEQEFQEQEDVPIKFLRGPEYWTNYPDDEVEAENKDRYVRTGIGVLDIDYIVSKEWDSSLEYEMAMAGVYIPVKNEKEELVFSYEDYESIRAKMKGLSYYETDPFEIDEKTKQMNSLYEVYRKYGGDNSKIEECEGIIKGKGDPITTSKNEATLKIIKEFFASQGIHVAGNLSSTLTVDEIELIDTGSTGRGTNVPGDGDFDFMLRHNLPPEVLSEFQSYMFKLPRENAISLQDGFRLKQVVLPDGQKVDIDVTYAKKDISLVYSSDISIKDRLKSIKENSLEDYNYVKANIIMAKNILKKLGIYKKRGSDGATEYGGFGGIGVENWILQNGGSFAQAINTYLEATKDENGKDLSYQEFIEKYPIFDFGNNHREGKLLHDRFSSFLGNASKDNLEQAFSFVKENFREIQRDLKTYQETKEYTSADQEPSVLRKSISVEGIREASKNRFADFCKENFVLMANLIAKYSKVREEGTRYQGNQLTNGDVFL